MNYRELLLGKINECKFDQGITSDDCMIINGYIGMYKKNQDAQFFKKIKSYTDERMNGYYADLMKLSRALRFLFEETKDEAYKEVISRLITYIVTAKRENGILIHENGTMYTAQEAFDLMPVYAWYETHYNKKEHYIDIMNQLRYLNDQMLVKNKAELYDRCTFMMALADTAVNMSEEIYEYYAQIKEWLKKAVHKKIYVVNSDCLRVAYSILKGCESRALLPEKYEEIGLKMIHEAADKLLAQESVEKKELGILLMTYALTI